jgi:hypothetical protein
MARCMDGQLQAFNLYLHLYVTGARGSVLGSGTMLYAGRSRVQFPNEVIGFFTLPYHSSRTMTLWSTQPLTEMSTKSLSGG